MPLAGPTEKMTRSFRILTIMPNAGMAELHDRMVVILEPHAWPVWLVRSKVTT
jgi:putative SOS response-associated peptidase YedK